MKKHQLLYLLMPVIFLQACNRDNKRAKNFNDKTLVDQQGMMFIKQANESGNTEIQASALAQSISKNPRIVGFAKMMIADHKQAGMEIGTLANDKLVNKHDTLNVAHQKLIDSIKTLKSVSFDKAYMNMMLKDHMEAVKLFEDASVNKNLDVQKLAKKILPKLKMHLDSAKAINSSLK
jgi:putative membrane protein